MDSVSYNLGRAVAPPVSVLLVTTLGYGWAFAANAVSFLVFAGCLLLAGQGQPAEQRREESRLKDGFIASRDDWQIAVLLLMVAAVTVADDPVLVLGPAVAAHLAPQPGLVGMVHRRARRWHGPRVVPAIPGTSPRSGWPPRRSRSWPPA